MNDTKDHNEQDQPKTPDEGAGEAPATGSSDELTALQTERDQLQDQLKHAMADMANMRRRAVKEAEEARRRIVEGFTQELLPVLDNFGLALQAFEQGDDNSTSSLFEGVRMVHTLLSSALERHGLALIPAEGVPFDPQRHEALAVEPQPGTEQGQILRVLQPGYMLGDRVLRHAKVVVAGDAQS